MFIPDFELSAWAEAGGLRPYEPTCINPASVDLRWSGRYRIARPDGWTDVYEAEYLTLVRGEFYLLDTAEVMRVPENWVGILALKSSMGRQGLEHLHAGWVDGGYGLIEPSSLTLEVENRAPWPLTITVGQRIVQLAFAECRPPAKSYAVVGRYNGCVIPQVALP